MSYYYSHLSSPASDVTDVENSFFREVRSECHNSSSVFSHRSDESSMNNFSPHSDSSSSEQPSYPEQSFSSAYGKFQNSTSPYQSSPEEVNRSDIIIENILKRSPIQLRELTDLSNALFSNEESDLSSILESAASVATALNVATQPLIVPKVEAPTLDDILMDHDGDYRNVTIKTEDGEQQQQQQQPSLLICPICGNEAGKHVHYGGRACTSCRAFFRRSVQHDAYKKFFCSSKNCKIDSKSWRSCKWCRFEKCLDSGLQPGWVLSDTERLARHEKRVSKSGSPKKRMKTKHEPEESTAALVPSSQGNSIHWSFSESELMTIRTTIQRGYNKMVKNLFSFYAQNRTLFSKLTSAVYHNSIVPYSVYTKWEKIWPSSVKTLAAVESKLATLSASDNEELLRENFPVVSILLQASLMMNRHAFKQSFLAEIMTRALTLTPGDNDPDDVKTLHDVMRDLNVGMNLPAGALAYSQVFASPWADSIDLEERHSQLVTQIGFWPVDHTDPEMPVDYAKLFLLCNIILLSTDRVDVKDKAKAAKLQDLHLNMLQRYLKHKYKEDANSHLVKGLSLMSMAREVIKIRSHRLPV